jgi:hypothetical protein
MASRIESLFELAQWGGPMGESRAGTLPQARWSSDPWIGTSPEPRSSRIDASSQAGSRATRFGMSRLSGSWRRAEARTGNQAGPLTGFSPGWSARGRAFSQ